MVGTLAFLPFRIVVVPTKWVGRVVAWFADGYREASSIERALIFPSWAVCRGVFLAGCALANVLHAAGSRVVRQV